MLQLLQAFYKQQDEIRGLKEELHQKEVESNKNKTSKRPHGFDASDGSLWKRTPRQRERERKREMERERERERERDGALRQPYKKRRRFRLTSNTANRSLSFGAAAAQTFIIDGIGLAVRVGRLAVVGVVSVQVGELRQQREDGVPVVAQFGDVRYAGQADVDEAEQLQVGELLCDSFNLSLTGAAVVQDQLLHLNASSEPNHHFSVTRGLFVGSSVPFFIAG
ncbi:hypothetical protein CCH79_00018606 [Gambusia affinis]|uniref:Uncharacterized protein n=1 Tax=Gambusia affinis TaxID=33528 RepID=A0A315VLZ9_GAMAF|nr:hypothetical protein CCH79_00018606 [Gambusia affinis]